MKEIKREQVQELLETYKYPKLGWRIRGLGFYKFNGKLEDYVEYVGQGTPEPIYNNTADYIIDIKDNIENLIDTYDLEDKENFEEIVSIIYEDVIDEINDNEE